MASPLPSERGEFQGKLLAAQHRKKQADNDRQLLLNRIALLKKEEARAWKKIEKTKGRAEEIIQMRMENEKRTEAREASSKKQRIYCQNLPPSGFRHWRSDGGEWGYFLLV